MGASPALAFLLSVAAASATMIGWAIAASRRSWSPRVFGWTLLAAGVAMVVISLVDLLPTAARGLGWLTALLFAAGGALLVIVLHVVAHRLELGGSALARSALLVAIAICIHNIPEGTAPFAAALLSIPAGIATTVAVGLHNIPEGLAVATPVLAAGGSRTRAFWYTAIATGGEILGAVIALTFANALTPSRGSALLALVAGVMITLSLFELGPSGAAMLQRSREEETERMAAGHGP